MQTRTFLPSAFSAVLDTRRPALAANQGHVRNVNRAFLFQDPAANLLVGIRPGVPLDHVDVLDKNLLLFRDHFQHAAGFALVAPGDDLHFVVLANRQRSH